MKAENVELYTWPTCPFCNRAKRLLNELEIPFIDPDIWGKDDEKPLAFVVCLHIVSMILGASGSKSLSD